MPASLWDRDPPGHRAYLVILTMVYLSIRHDSPCYEVAIWIELGTDVSIVVSSLNFSKEPFHE